MFVLTLNKESMKKVAIAACCTVALAGAVFAMNRMFTGGQVQETAVQPSAPTEIESTQDMASFFTAYGLELDPSTVTMDKVKVPSKWDESFTAFNAEIEKSGLSLQKYKGKTVEKWMMLCPTASSEEQKSYGVLLIYKEDAVGAYMLQKPSGEVTALTATTAAPLTEQEVQTDFASQQGAAVDSAPTTAGEQTADAASQPQQQANADMPAEVDDAAMPTE